MSIPSSPPVPTLKNDSGLPAAKKWGKGTTRRLATRALDDFLEKSRPLPEAMSDLYDSLGGAPQQERRLATELVYGTLRNMAGIDHALALWVKKSKPELSNLLRLGAYQVLFLDHLPVHAAVDETVAAVSHDGLKGFVNAVLRNLVRHRQSMREAIASHPDPLVKYSVNQALWKLLNDNFGSNSAGAILDACSTQPAVLARVNTQRTTPAELAQRLSYHGITAQVSQTLPYCLEMHGAISELVDVDAHREGLFFLQGYGAQVAAAALRASAGDLILDCCAGKGGKSMALALDSQDRARICAVERDESQLAILHRNVNRLGLTCIEPLHMAVEDLELQRPFNKVLVDAPCSSLGELAKYPDLRWRFSERMVQACAKTQLRLLLAAAGYVAPGGLLLYAVCTFTEAETTQIASSFLAARPEFSVIPIEHAGSSADYFRLLPTAKTGGFFAALFVKSGVR